MPARTIKSPTGALTLVEEDGALIRLDWGDGGTDKTPLLEMAATQINEYFQRSRTEFDLPLAPRVSLNQQRFLDALIAIPYGETRTYGEMAKALNISAQAAGQACGANPIGIIIPCHRVTGTGNLGGFSAPDGIEKKVELLKLEGAASLLI
jgi:methylated-DNA-[protein]-cysteine S-methyltransferase